MKSGIYEILNTVNSKLYIGSAVRLKKRFTGHLNLLRRGKHNNRHLQAAFNKYGEAKFLFFPIEHVEDPKDLIPKEQFWITALDACDRSKGYNIAPTAGSQAGFCFSEESKLKMSVSQTGRKHTEETKKKISARQKGLKRGPLSEEHRLNLSKAGKGR